MSEPKLDLSVVLGGEELAVQLLDGSTEQVRVRYLPVATYPEFATALDDEPLQVALFTARSRAWAEGLHPESHDSIMVKGHALNLPFFERWVSRRKVALRAADPAWEGRMQQLIEDVVRGALAQHLQDAQRVELLTASASRDSSPASPSSPDSPAST